MISALLGVVAALAWGLHDFLGRFVTRALGATLTSIVVILSGAACLTAMVLLSGRSLTIAADDIPAIVLTGLIYGAALLFLFAGLKAGSLALVALVVGSYPATTVIIAILRGAPPTALQLIAIAAVLTGMATVVLGERPAETAAGTPAHDNVRALAFAAMSHLCFAVSISIGHGLIGRIGGAELTWAVRIAGLLLLPALLLGRDRPAAVRIGNWLPAAAAMGALDVVGLGAVLAAGAFPYPELGPVVSSGYGAVAVMLALVVLREPLTRWQMLGIVLSVAGTVVLALPAK